jgi:hypothetical protein
MGANARLRHQQVCQDAQQTNSTDVERVLALQVHYNLRFSVAGCHGETVEAWQLGERKIRTLTLSHSRIAERERFFVEHIRCQTQLKQFRTQVAEFRALVASLKAHYEE